MRIDVKSFTKKDSTLDYAKRVTFTADDRIDAVQLAALARAFTSDDSPRMRQWRKEVLERHCRENDVTITWETEKTQ